MVKIITLKYAGKCIDCGASLSKGSHAKWYGRGRIACHSCNNIDSYTPGEPEGLTRSRYDKYGVYTPDGAQIGSTCNCEDYPCCGH